MLYGYQVNSTPKSNASRFTGVSSCGPLHPWTFPRTQTQSREPTGVCGHEKELAASSACWESTTEPAPAAELAFTPKGGQALGSGSPRIQPAPMIFPLIKKLLPAFIFSLLQPCPLQEGFFSEQKTKPKEARHINRDKVVPKDTQSHRWHLSLGVRQLSSGLASPFLPKMDVTFTITLQNL